MSVEKRKEVTQEDIARFMEGRDPEKRIVNLHYDYMSANMTVIYRNENDEKCMRQEPFYPFCWATRYACQQLCEGDRSELKRLMREYGIAVERLSNISIEGEERHEFDNGYLYKWYATHSMSYSKFLEFFRRAKYPVYRNRKDKKGNPIPIDKKDEGQYLIVSPQEQYLIATGKRFFKGYDDYDDILRMTFDLETQGLDPRKDRIKLNGVRLNRPINIQGTYYQSFERIFRITGKTKEEMDASELRVIVTMLKLIYTFRPDVITAHNGENFDWNFLIVRCEELGTSMEELSKEYFDGLSIKKDKRESILKLGGEMEKFYRTIVPYTIVTDSMHAVRRTQATDSNFKEHNLKYATNYLGLKKPNRVYTPGNEIDSILTDEEHEYCLCEEDGDWYMYDPNCNNGPTDYFKKGKNGNKKFVKYTRNYVADGYELVSGEYIINRYLLDDIWECDRVEYALNSTDFMLSKIIPVPYQKVCTMGTAGQWKAIMLAWSYENGLAIPKPEDSGAFTGGLSRLLCVGAVKNVVKLDYNSLYPSIILTWGITDRTDLMHAMLYMLEYVLTTREHFKGLKKKAGKIVDKCEEELNAGIKFLADRLQEYEVARKDYKLNDNKQASVKKLGNSFFGSYGSNKAHNFPWKSVKCAEQTTCIGRQCLRLMISHFSNLGYKPIVGDSVTPDTPLFIKYKKTKLIDIKPISEIMDESVIETDALGREYDKSKKPYWVLCRSGWKDVSYVYRHKTDKAIYRVKFGEVLVDLTEDHSLYDRDKNPIKPSEINNGTQLEYYREVIGNLYPNKDVPEKKIEELALKVANYELDRIPVEILNAKKKDKYRFFIILKKNWDGYDKRSKTLVAGLNYIKM